MFHKRERRIKGQNSLCMLITKLDKYATNKEDCWLIFLMSIYENIPLKIVINMCFLVLPLYSSPKQPSHYFLFSSPFPSPLPFPFHFSSFLPSSQCTQEILTIYPSQGDPSISLLGFTLFLSFFGVVYSRLVIICFMSN